VFIDLGGIDGLVHKSELSWNKVNNPEAGYKVGEEVEAEVIDINHERGRISLSIRRLQPDPWHSTVADFKVGDIIDGTVTKLVNFGAFVRVRDGLEGLIHISELSHQRVAHPGDVVHEGQTSSSRSSPSTPSATRLGLSLKQAEEPRPARLPSRSRRRAGAGRPPERRPRPERSYSMSDAIQEPEGGIDNTLASAFAQVRQQLAAAEVEEIAQGVAADEAVEEAAATEQVEQIAETVAADETAEEAAAAEAIDEVAETVAADEAAEEAIAAETVETIVGKVAEDEAALEAEANAELDRLADVAAAKRGQRAGRGRCRVADVVEGVAEQEAFEEATAADRIAGVVETVAEDEAIEEAFAADKIEEIVEATAADEARRRRPPARPRDHRRAGRRGRGGGRGRRREEVATVARKTMEKNTEG
jgi:small subunit ribosomal protein S1